MALNFCEIFICTYIDTLTMMTCRSQSLGVVRHAGHSHWVLYVAWSPDGKRLASGCKNGDVSF